MILAVNGVKLAGKRLVDVLPRGLAAYEFTVLRREDCELPAGRKPAEPAGADAAETAADPAATSAAAPAATSAPALAAGGADANTGTTDTMLLEFLLKRYGLNRTAVHDLWTQDYLASVHERATSLEKGGDSSEVAESDSPGRRDDEAAAVEGLNSLNFESTLDFSHALDLLPSSDAGVQTRVNESQPGWIEDGPDVASSAAVLEAGSEDVVVEAEADAKEADV